MISNSSILFEVSETIEKLNHVFDKSATLNFIINRLLLVSAVACSIIGSVMSFITENIMMASIIFMILVILIGVYLGYVCCSIKFILWKCKKILEDTNMKSKLKIHQWTHYLSNHQKFNNR